MVLALSPTLVAAQADAPDTIPFHWGDGDSGVLLPAYDHEVVGWSGR